MDGCHVVIFVALSICRGYQVIWAKLSTHPEGHQYVNWSCKFSFIVTSDACIIHDMNICFISLAHVTKLDGHFGCMYNQWYEHLFYLPCTCYKVRHRNQTETKWHLHYELKKFRNSWCFFSKQQHKREILFVGWYLKVN